MVFFLTQCAAAGAIRPRSDGFTRAPRAAPAVPIGKRRRTVCLLVDMLTELAVGLGRSSAPGVANAVRPKPRDKFFTHGRKSGPPLFQPPGRNIKLAKNCVEVSRSDDAVQVPRFAQRNALSLFVLGVTFCARNCRTSERHVASPSRAR